MAKYQRGHYIELPRSIFTDERFLKLSDSAKWLFLILKELEHRYSGSKEDWFFRSNKELAEDCGWNIKKLERVKPELIESGLINSWQMHWRDPETGKKSEKHISAYRVFL